MASTAYRLQRTTTPFDAHDDRAHVAENGTKTGNVLANDKTGLSASSFVTVTNFNGGALGAPIVLANAEGATLTLYANGHYVLDASAAAALSEGEHLNFQFKYGAKGVSEGMSWGADTAILRVCVEGTNDGPVANDDSAGCVNVNLQATGNVLGNDSDIDRLDVLSVASVNGAALNDGEITVTLASGAVVTMHADGSYSYDTNHAFDSLNAGDQATDSFEYTVGDGHGGTDTAVVSICVDGIQFEGLSHGYWKNHTEDWNIALDTKFEAFFGVDGGDWTFKVKGKDVTVADILFTDALGIQGNVEGEEALAREAIAAVLNATEAADDEDGFAINYKYSVDEIIGMVQSAFASGDKDVMNGVKDTLEQENTLDLFHIA